MFCRVQARTPISCSLSTEIGIRPMGASDTELDSKGLCSLLNASQHEVNALQEQIRALNAVNEENSALKKINKELEDNFEMTCSSQADQLNKNKKTRLTLRKLAGLRIVNWRLNITGKFFNSKNA